MLDKLINYLVTKPTTLEDRWYTHQVIYAVDNALRRKPDGDHDHRRGGKRKHRRH